MDWLDSCVYLGRPFSRPQRPRTRPSPIHQRAGRGSSPGSASGEQLQNFLVLLCLIFSFPSHSLCRRVILVAHLREKKLARISSLHRQNVHLLRYFCPKPRSLTALTPNTTLGIGEIIILYFSFQLIQRIRRAAADPSFDVSQ